MPGEHGPSVVLPCAGRSSSPRSVRSLPPHQGTYANPQHDPRAQDNAVYACNPKCMQRLMAELGISATTPRRFVRTTRRDEEVPLPDLVGQDFAPGEPGRRSVSDSTTSAQVRAWLPRHGGR